MESVELDKYLASLPWFAVAIIVVVREFLLFLKAKTPDRNHDHDIMLEAIQTQNKAILRLIDHVDEIKRISYRTEKVLDRIDQKE